MVLYKEHPPCAALRRPGALSRLPLDLPRAARGASDLASRPAGQLHRYSLAGWIDALADALGVSRQHLASQFRARVGLPAKVFARVCRFQHASKLIREGGPRDWASLALELGYYDQPHMIHEFRELAGSTPQSFAPA